MKKCIMQKVVCRLPVTKGNVNGKIYHAKSGPQATDYESNVDGEVHHEKVVHILLCGPPVTKTMGMGRCIVQKGVYRVSLTCDMLSEYSTWATTYRFCVYYNC